jgi:hypothetical protein
MSTLEPPVGRDAYLDELSSSDLSVEELLASGADVGDLVSAGVVYDDYPAGHEFTEEVPEEEAYDGPPMSDERYEKLMAGAQWLLDVHRLGKNAPPRPI